uniref:Uncharacterized protein n=1 Tax=uncultured Desulfobacterium sp. TaxID=201089 RepID=E1YI93_9BACT|nr:unknown protein [uncultured Desulfobacterium sp.]
MLYKDKKTGDYDEKKVNTISVYSFRTDPGYIFSGLRSGYSSIKSVW